MDIRNGKWLYQEVMDYFNEKATSEMWRIIRPIYRSDQT
ncbi:UNVERIFIED_ORG: hypothetical protein [Escherichia phage CMSTMSU]